MKLGRLCSAAGLATAPDSADANVTGFAIDHRKIAAGNVFGAFHGRNADGETFIPAAVQAGAIAVVARP